MCKIIKIINLIFRYFEVYLDGDSRDSNINLQFTLRRICFFRICSQSKFFVSTVENYFDTALLL